MRKVLLTALVVYIASTLVSYGVFSATLKSQDRTPILPGPDISDETADESTATVTSRLQIDPQEPRDQACPISGKLYTQTEKREWEQRRPLAVMIENHPEARPQSGLIRADVVYEAMAEGGVTRFMGIFYCDAVRDDVILAPIRSARTYFIDWASGYNQPLYIHVGGANTPGPANALGQLSEYGWVGNNDLNQFSIGYPTFIRNYNRLEGKEIATEHTMVTSTEKLWAVGAERGFTAVDPEGNDWLADFEPWSFEDGQAGDGTATQITYEFWDGFSEYGVKWQYNPETNLYLRNMAGEPHLDLESGQQIAVSNVIVLFQKEKGPIDELKHMLYKTTGTGTALLFRNGEVEELNWSKPKRESRLQFATSKGKTAKFNRGQFWISVVDVGTKVEY